MKALDIVLSWLLAPLLLVAAIGLGAYIDAQPDAREETANALALQDAQRAAAQEQRLQHAAYQACKADHGPNVAVAWNFEGQLVCQPKRGKAVLHATRGAL